MWLFKDKVASLEDSGIMAGMTDWHSHILPGVDDGFQSLDDSLEALEYFDSKGLDSLWLTPHIMEDYPNTTDNLKKRFELLKDAWTGKLKLKLASENMLDTLFEERLEARDLLPIGDNRDHLLVETSYFSAPIGFDNIIDKIMAAGYFPLLAHPERYVYMGENDYKKLRDKGVKMQLNYVSLVGGYGETAKKKSIWLLKNGMIDVVGSDIHRLKSNQSLVALSPSKKEHLEMLKSVVSLFNSL